MANTQRNASAASSAPLPAVPPFARGAATARIPVTPFAAIRGAVAGLRRGAARLTRLTRRDDTAVRPHEITAWRLWAEAAYDRLVLLLGRLRRARAARPLTVFVAPATPLSERPADSAPR